MRTGLGCSSLSRWCLSYRRYTSFGDPEGGKHDVAQPVVAAKAGRIPGLQSDASGPAWLHSAFGGVNLMRILLGPILLIMDVAPANVRLGIALTATLIPALALVAFKRRPWAALLSVLALLVWLFLGVVAAGIQC